MAAKREYNACREKEKLRGSKKEEMANQAKRHQIQPLSSKIGENPDELDSNDCQHWKIERGSQNEGVIEVEEDIKSLSLTPSLRKRDKKSNSVSAKHVTYEEDMVVGKTEEKVQEIYENSETAEAIDREKKAKRRKMIENAKRRKAEAEARIEAEKALEGARKKQQQQEGAQTVS